MRLFYWRTGTGTPAGDPQEAAAIASAFFKDKEDTADDEQDRLFVGSIKTSEYLELWKLVHRTPGSLAVGNALGHRGTCEFAVLKPTKWPGANG